MVLNSLALDPTLFNVTPIQTGLSGPIAIASLSDGSLAVGTFSGILRFAGPGSVGTNLFTDSGFHTGLLQAGGYYISANSASSTITLLKPGATPDAPFTNAGQLQFGFSADWEHLQMGIAVRPTPGQPGSFDLVFNVGSRFDAQASGIPASLSGLVSGNVDGDSIYMVTLNLSGGSPVASNLHKVAAGIRNVIGMGFDPNTGDFYFADNAIDGPGPDGDEPPQAEEINRILAATFGIGAAPDFGYPNCYIQYRTGAAVGSGCVQPLYAIQPIPNGTALGSESEGVAGLAFAPANFPAGFNHGLFLGFSGKGFATGPANDENGVGYYDLNTGTYIHFVENSQDGVMQPIGFLSTPDHLFVVDDIGTIYDITAAVPEPGAVGLVALGLAAIAGWKRKNRHHAN